MAFRWVLRGKPLESDESNHSGYPDIVKNLVTQRGIPENEIESFLHPKLRDLADPFLIPEMELAVTRILEAVDQKQSVCIYGDYDVDGVSSITLLSKILNAYGIQTRTFIPRRGVEGYGLSFAAIERCMSEGTKPDLLITVDCGTVSIDEIAHLRAQGIDVVVVDHHEPSPQGRPDCCALVNPKCGTDFTYLCAAGVVFKLGHALLKKRPTDLELKDLLDLTAVATISDIVPMIGENRILVRHGLKRLASSSNPGLQALKEITGIKELPTSMDVGFRIGPRLNAAGRMDFPEDALATLTTTCQIEATTLANKLEQYNRQRQDFEKQIRDDAMEQLSNFNPSNDPVIVIGSRDWHHGVVGIIASRLMRQYYKPTFVIAIDENGIGKGSGRSIEGVSLVDAIRNCEDELIAGGGHAMAAGLSIHEDSLDRFKEKFASFVLENSSEEDRMPRLVYDAEIDFSELSLKFLDSYELLQPFGNCNPQPIFVSRGVELCGTPIQMKNNHLRLKMRQADDEKSAVYFGGGDRDLPPTPWDIAFTIDRNNFRGNTSLQIVIQDIIASKSV
ncbi:MAG: single-stranded-DNA-specific exonuclease RecJ [Akkermansiaceae bacterium]|jgi:single-stranded-DNA-specific exonuclease|nr:single-stranded-DNA-specific exonuclease RecJ [Luteolibacter sp.]